MNDKFSVTRITTEALTALRILTEQDGLKSPVKMLDRLIFNELASRGIAVELPHPPDGEVVPLVYLKG